MSISEKIREKTKKIKHKEIIFFVIIIVLILVIGFYIKTPSYKSSSVDFESMSAKEELTYRITDAINALSGDSESKIVIYWDSAQKESDNSFSSIFQGSASKDDDTNVRGVAVVCKNGNSPETKVRIIFMLSNVFGISADRISVYGKK